MSVRAFEIVPVIEKLVEGKSKTKVNDVAFLHHLFAFPPLYIFMSLYIYLIDAFPVL